MLSHLKRHPTFTKALLCSLALSILEILVCKGPVVLFSSYIVVSIFIIIVMFQNNKIDKIKLAIIYLLLVNLFIIFGAIIHNSLILSYIKDEKSKLPINRTFFYHNYSILLLEDSAVFEQFGWWKKVYNYKEDKVEDRTLD